MGKNRKSRGKKNARYASQQGDGERGNYPAIASENARYEAHYRESGLIPDREWDDFWGALRRTLPTTFRFTGSKGHALSVLKSLRDTLIPHLEGIEWERQPVSPPTPIPWYPDDLAWQLTIGKSTIRRCPPFKKFQNFLVAETTVGNVSRQEAVSMIPPLLMDIEPHHTVLDMCAAPGSKTAQLIEAIHAGEEASVQELINGEVQPGTGLDGEAGGRPTGLVIANDSDYKRSHMLIHQTKRLNSANLIVTNHDATMYPSLLLTLPEGKRKDCLKFDRILADVPCSGDGTARKNPNVWRDWSPSGALGLHLTQVRILVRGLQMLKVGGRIVYSTCSMNPIENEAVVAAAIDRCGGLEKVGIVDCSNRLPELKRKPGVKGGWRVMDKDHTWFNNLQEVENADSKGVRLSRIVPSMFPSEDGKEDDDPTRIPLEKCIRVYPHLQDTGGFFITVLEKKSEIRAIKHEDHGRRRMGKSYQAATGSAMGVDKPIENTDVIGDPIPPSDKDPMLPPKEDSIQPESPSKRKPTSNVSPTTPPVAKKIKANTGGIEEEQIPETANAEAPGTPTNAPSQPTKKKGQQQEEFFKYLAPDHPVLETIYKFYDLSPRFPRTCFMVRNVEGTPTRAIYFTNHLAKGILTANEGKNVKFVHCGVKAFMKQDVQEAGVCEWRIQNEGLSILEGWIGESRVVRARKRATVHGLLKELFPKVNKEGQGDVIGEIEDQVRDMKMGCCVLKVEPGESEDQFSDRMVFPLWKSRFSCNLMLPKEERKAMLMRLFNDEESIKDSTNKNSVLYRQEQEREKALSAPDQHLARMSLALAEAKKCTPTSTAFCVGAILTTASGDILSTGYSREHPGNTHAEQVCLDKLQDLVPEGAILYTTMEPCSERLSGNKPCTNRILENGKIRTVYVGVLEPGTFVENTGRVKLEEAGVEYVLVPGLEKECLAVAKRGHEGADLGMGESSV